MKDRSLRAWDDLLPILDTLPKKRALEIGTWDGVTTRKLCAIFDHVETVDVLHPGRVRDNMTREGVSNVTFRHGDSHQVLRKLGASDHRFDFVLVDGLHNYSQAIDDIRLSLPMLDGLLVVDDVDWSSGVRKAATEVGAEIVNSLAFLWSPK